MNSTPALLGWGNQELMIVFLLGAAIAILPRLSRGKPLVIQPGERFLMGVLLLLALLVFAVRS